MIKEDMKRLNELISKNEVFKECLEEDERNLLDKIEEVVSSDYYTHSYDLFDKIMISETQYPSVNGRMLKIIEMLDKNYSAVFEALTEIQRVQERLNKDSDDYKESELEVNQYSLIIYKRTLKGTLRDISELLKLADECLKKLDAESFADLDWDSIKMNAIMDKAGSMLSFIQQNKGQLDPNVIANLSSQERAAISALTKDQASKPKIHKANAGQLPNLRK